MHRMRKLIEVVLGVLVVAGGVGLWHWRGEAIMERLSRHEEAHTDVEETSGVPVTVVTAARQTLETTIDVVGTLKGWEDVNVGAEASGRIIKVLHDVGDRVKPGEPLVELEAINADLAVRQAEQRLVSDLAKLGLREFPGPDFDITQLPSVKQAQVAVDRAEDKFGREQQLAERRVNTVESLRDAEFDLRDKQAALDNALLTARAALATAMATRVDVDVARQKREDLIVRAPEPTHPPEGRREPLEYAITKRTVSEGQMIREGEQVAELLVDNPLRMWVNVPERFSPDVAVGQEVRLTVPAHRERTFGGTVTWVNPGIDTDSRTFQVEVLVPNHDGALRPGGFAKASIVTSKTTERITVPVEAVIHFAGVTKLFMVRDEKAFSVPVETGREGSGWIEVVGEVPEAATVVVTGHMQLADGTAVVIRATAGGDGGATQQATGEAAQRPAAEAAQRPTADMHDTPSDVTSG